MLRSEKYINVIATGKNAKLSFTQAQKYHTRYDHTKKNCNVSQLGRLQKSAEFATVGEKKFRCVIRSYGKKSFVSTQHTWAIMQRNPMIPKYV